MKRTFYIAILYLSLFLSMAVIGLGFGELIKLTDNNAIKLLLIALFLFCELFWPYCIFMKTDEFIEKDIRRDKLRSEWKRKNKKTLNSMTYDEANRFRSEHLEVVGNPSTIDSKHRIKHLLIAPKDISFEERMKVLNETCFKPIDNKKALENLGLLNRNLEVYAIWEEGNEKFEVTLYDYLRGSGAE